MLHIDPRGPIGIGCGYKLVFGAGYIAAVVGVAVATCGGGAAAVVVWASRAGNGKHV